MSRSILLLLVVCSTATATAIAAPPPTPAQDCHSGHSARRPPPDAVVAGSGTPSQNGIPVYSTLQDAFANIKDRHRDWKLTVCVEPGYYPMEVTMLHGAKPMYLYSALGSASTTLYANVFASGRMQVDPHPVYDPGHPPLGGAADVSIAGFFVFGGQQATGAGCTDATETKLSLSDMHYWGCTGLVGALSSVGRDLSIVNSSFDNSHATQDGGGVRFEGGSLGMKMTTFTNNSADNMGGALHVSDPTAISMSGMAFDGNTAASAGGLSVVSVVAPLPQIYVFDSTFTDNQAVSGAGGASLVGDLTMEDSLFEANTGWLAGGLSHGFGAASLERVDFLDNDAHQAGGLRLDYVGDVSMADCRFEGNTAASYGGGLYATNAADLSIEDCVFEGGVAPGYPAILAYSSTSIEVHRTAIRDNHATVFPVSHFGASMVSLSNVLVVENSSRDAAVRVSVGPIGMFFMEFVTIAWNEAAPGGDGGGLKLVGWTPPQGIVTSSVFAFNGAADAQIDNGGGLFGEHNLYFQPGATTLADVTDTVYEADSLVTNPLFEADPTDLMQSSADELPPSAFSSVVYDYSEWLGGSPLLGWPTVQPNCHGDLMIGAYGGPDGCWN